jgi:opacity protein-like surface antigen
MRRPILVAVLMFGVLLVRPAPAAADITAFLGFVSTPDSRSSRGFAFAVDVLMIGFEYEFARTVPGETGAPELTTHMFNAMITTPTGDVQLYATAGGGLYNERFLDGTKTNVGTNIGGGVKIDLAGPLRLRLDYRLFTLRGSPVAKNPQRFYAGITVAF